jgi:hypothetical protein
MGPTFGVLPSSERSGQREFHFVLLGVNPCETILSYILSSPFKTPKLAILPLRHLLHDVSICRVGFWIHVQHPISVQVCSA